MNFCEDLSLELKLCVIKFLEPRDLCALEATRRRYSLANSVFEMAWKGYCIDRWGLTDEEGLLLPRIGEEIWTYRSLYRLCWPLCDELESFDGKLKTDNNAAHFMGTVGQGNRSVQSLMTLPLFQRAKSGQYWLFNVCQFFFTKYSECRRQRAWSLDEISNETDMGPIRIGMSNRFSMPFWDSRSMRLCVTPRDIAYYEVIIEEPLHGMASMSSSGSLSSLANPMAAGGLEGDTGGDVATPSYDSEDRALDCIAVGIASDKFLSNQRFPGWDKHSYGYHSDDGAIFHGRGRQLAPYGPKFGAGDVVGCGVDYARGEIFFTLNGSFLGVAFSELTQAEYRPTIGLDAHVNIVVNFGRTPFKFDLARHMRVMRGRNSIA